MSEISVKKTDNALEVFLTYTPKTMSLSQVFILDLAKFILAPLLIIFQCDG